MKKMNTLFSILIMLLFCGMGNNINAQAGLEDVIVEEVDASPAGEGLTSYRVYIDLAEGYELQQVYGNDEEILTIATTTTWFNDGAGATSGDLMNAGFFGPPFNELFPGFPYDSYVSLGAASQTEWGVLLSDDTEDGSVDGRAALGNIPAVGFLGATIMDMAGANFGAAATTNTFMEDDDGQFFTLVSNADIGVDNKILVGQFTTDGDFSFCLNIQTRVAGTNDFATMSWNDVPMLKFGGDDIIGCMDQEACNFNPDATIEEDDSCVYALGCDECGDDGGVIDNPEVGETCDDGDENTYDDTVGDDCVCTGIPYDCPNQTNIGDTCDDNDPDTIDDEINENCECVGVEEPIFGCTDEDACNYDPEANVDDESCQVPTGCDICFEGFVVDLPDVGESCDDGDENTFDDTVGEDCVCVGTPYDCPNQTNIGDSCDDGDENTSNDTVGDDCVCAGIAGCDAEPGAIFTESETTVCVGDDEDDFVDVLIEDAGVGTNGTLVITDEDLNILGIPDGLSVNFEGAGTGVCLIWWLNFEDDLVGAEVGLNAGDLEGCFALSNSIAVTREECPEYDCPELEANFGDSCDDGDPNTSNDMVGTDCVCAGEGPDCPELGLNIGDACDDNDPDTFNDMVTDDCVCVGMEETDCEDVDLSIWGMGPWYDVVQGTFVAEGANDAVLARGTGDVTIDIYDGECGGNLLGSYNNTDGGIERAVNGGLVAGETYSYFVSGATDIESKVKTYADSRLEDEYCNVSVAEISQIYALREDDMYSNPAVYVTGYGFRFVNTNTNAVVILDDVSVDGFYQQLSAIPGLSEGETYAVSVRHQVIQMANGIVQSLWSEYGTICDVEIVSPEDMAEGANNSLFDLESTAFEATIFPNPNAGEFVFLNLSDLSSADHNVTVKIMDAFGRVIQSEQRNNSGESISLEFGLDSDIAAGLYMVSIEVDSKRVVKTLIIK